MKGVTEERLLEEIKLASDMGRGVYAASLLELIRLCKELNPWQTIKNAPKDRRILLFYLKTDYSAEKIIFGQWNPDEFIKNPKPYLDNDHSLLYGRNHTKRNQPSHWQELPPDPE